MTAPVFAAGSISRSSGPCRELNQPRPLTGGRVIAADAPTRCPALGRVNFRTGSARPWRSFARHQRPAPGDVRILAAEEVRFFPARYDAIAVYPTRSQPAHRHRRLYTWHCR